MDLPVDILHLICSLISLEDISNLLSVCTKTHDIRHHIIPKIEDVMPISNTELSLTAAQAREYLRIRSDKTLFVGPTGFGKTYIAIKWLLEKLRIENTAIIWCPRYTVKTWISIFTQMGYYNESDQISYYDRDPSKSIVLDRTLIKAHRDCVTSGGSGFKFKKDTKNRSLKKTIIIASSIDKINEIYKPDIFVEDEATNYYSVSRRFELRENTKFVLSLSYSDNTAADGYELSKGFYYTCSKVFAKGNPEDHAKLEIISEGTRPRECVFSIVERIRESEGKDKRICVVSAGRLGFLHPRLCKTSIIINDNPNSLQKFHDQEGSTCLVNVNEIYGLTINADCVILSVPYDFRILSVFMRRDSHQEKVTFYVPDVNHFSGVLRDGICSYNNPRYDFDIKFRMVADLIGMDIEKSTNEDIMIIKSVTRGTFPRKFYIENEDKCSLTPEMAKEARKIAKEILL